MAYSLYVDCKSKEEQENIFNSLNTIPSFNKIVHGSDGDYYKLVKGNEIDYLADGLKYPVGYNYNAGGLERVYIEFMIAELVEAYKLKVYYDSEPYPIKSYRTRFTNIITHYKNIGKSPQEGFDSAVRQLQIMPLSFKMILENNLTVNEETIKAYGVYQLFTSICPFT